MPQLRNKIQLVQIQEYTMYLLKIFGIFFLVLARLKKLLGNLTSIFDFFVIIKFILIISNRYAEQKKQDNFRKAMLLNRIGKRENPPKKPKLFETSAQKIKIFFGILLRMSLLKLNSIDDYFDESDDTFRTKSISIFPNLNLLII